MDFGKDFCNGTSSLCRWSNRPLYLCPRCFASVVLSPREVRFHRREREGGGSTLGGTDSAIPPCIEHCCHFNLREEMPIYISTYLDPPRACSLRPRNAVSAAAACTGYANHPCEIGTLPSSTVFGGGVLKTVDRKDSSAQH